MRLFECKGDVPEDDGAIPFGQADFKRKGADVTVVATSFMVQRSLAAAETLTALIRGIVRLDVSVPCSQLLEDANGPVEERIVDVIHATVGRSRAHGQDAASMDRAHCPHPERGITTRWCRAETGLAGAA